MDLKDKIVKIEFYNKLLKKLEFKINQFKDIEERVFKIHKKNNYQSPKIYRIIYLIELYLLRLYINKSLNKILIDHDLRKLIKSEILKVPGDILSEFINLYNDIGRQLRGESE